MPTASIIIRCFNEEAHIGRLLDGIGQQTLADREVIIVDSGSTDRTLHIAAQYPARIVHIEPEKFSFGRSLNLGCEAACGEFLVMISAHCYPLYRDWLERMIQPFANPRVGLVYGKQRGNEITQYSEHQVFATWFPNESTEDQKHPFCNNANCAIRRRLWERMPYDEELTGLEDLAWAKWLLSEGYQIAYNAEAEIVHVHEETWAKIYNRYRREAIAYKRLFPQEHMSLLEFVRLLITNVSSDYFHAVHDRVLLKNLLSIPAFRLMQFWGAYRGLHHAGSISPELKRRFYYPRGLQRPAAGDSCDSQRERVEYDSVTAEVVPAELVRN